MTTADWTVLDIPGVEQVAGRAARRVANSYPDVAEYDDLYQEALMLLATDAAKVRTCVADPGLGLGVLHTRLRLDLLDLVKTSVRRASKHVSRELLVERAEA